MWIGGEMMTQVFVWHTAWRTTSHWDAALAEIGFAYEGVDEDTITAPAQFDGLLEDFQDFVLIASVQF